MKYPKEFKDYWKRPEPQSLREQVTETIYELYGVEPARNEHEAEEFCRLDRFRDFMLKAFVPSTTKH